MHNLFSDMRASRFWATGLLFVALGFGLWKAGSMIVLVIASVVIAVFIETLSGYLERIGVPRFLSIVLVFIGVLGIIGLLLVSAIPVFIKEISALKPLLPQGDSIDKIIQAINANSSSDNVSPFVPVSSSVVAQLTSSAKGVSQGIFRLIVGTFGGFINFILLSMLSLYLALEDRAIERLIRAVAPRQNEGYLVSLWNRIRIKTEGWFRGQLIIALLASVSTYIGLLVLGVPYALLLALLAGILGIIPFGIVAAFLPALGIAFAHGTVLTPVYVTILYGLMQYCMDYIVQPLLTRRSTGLPPLLVIISIVVSITLFGFLGFFISIPAAIFLLEIVRDIERRKQEEAEAEAEEADPVVDIEEIADLEYYAPDGGRMSGGME